jgi:hypothetical protein
MTGKIYIFLMTEHLLALTGVAVELQILIWPAKCWLHAPNLVRKIASFMPFQ